jgi:hypothetical protein
MRLSPTQMAPKQELPLRICPEAGDCAGFGCFHHQPHAHIEDCERRCEPACGCTIRTCEPYTSDPEERRYMKPQRQAVRP